MWNGNWNKVEIMLSLRSMGWCVHMDRDHVLWSVEFVQIKPDTLLMEICRHGGGVSEEE